MNFNLEEKKLKKSNLKKKKTYKKVRLPSTKDENKKNDDETHMGFSI